MKPPSSEMTMEADFGTEKDLADMWDEDRIDISADSMTLDEMLDYLFKDPLRPGDTLPLGSETARISCICCYDLRNVIEASIGKGLATAPDLATILRTYTGEGTYPPKMPVLTRQDRSEECVSIWGGSLRLSWDFHVSDAEWMDFLDTHAKWRGIRIKEKDGHAEGIACWETFRDDDVMYIAYKAETESAGILSFGIRLGLPVWRSETLEEYLAEIREAQRELEAAYMHMLELQHKKLESVLEKLSYAVESAHNIKAAYPPATETCRMPDSLSIEGGIMEENIVPLRMSPSRHFIRNWKTPRIYKKGYAFVGHKSLQNTIECLSHQIASMTDEQIANEDYLMERFAYQPAICRELRWNSDFATSCVPTYLSDWKCRAYRQGCEAVTKHILESIHVIGKHLADKEARKRGLAG